MSFRISSNNISYTENMVERAELPIWNAGSLANQEIETVDSKGNTIIPAENNLLVYQGGKWKYVPSSVVINLTSRADIAGTPDDEVKIYPDTEKYNIYYVDAWVRLLLTDPPATLYITIDQDGYDGQVIQFVVNQDADQTFPLLGDDPDDLDIVEIAVDNTTAVGWNLIQLRSRGDAISLQYNESPDANFTGWTIISRHGENATVSTREDE